MRNKLWRVAGLYAHHDDSEDIFSTPTDIAFSLQHMLLIPLMITTKWSSFFVIQESEVLSSFTKQHPYVNDWLRPWENSFIWKA
jgi:hypothetical protein